MREIAISNVEIDFILSLISDKKVFYFFVSTEINFFMVDRHFIVRDDYCFV